VAVLQGVGFQIKVPGRRGVAVTPFTRGGERGVRPKKKKTRANRFWAKWDQRARNFPRKKKCLGKQSLNGNKDLKKATTKRNRLNSFRGVKKG